MTEVLVCAALCPPGEEHQAAWELLAQVLARELGIESLPEVAKGGEGKPFFPERPGYLFQPQPQPRSGGLRRP